MKRTNLLRASGVAAAALLLSGCVLPPIATAAFVAADVASYGATGKTVSDHGLSFVMQQDCAMLRVLDREKPVCVEQDEAATATVSDAWKDADETADVPEEARRKMEAEVELGYPASAGVAVRLPADDRLFHAAAYLVAGAAPARPVPVGPQLSGADRPPGTIF